MSKMLQWTFLLLVLLTYQHHANANSADTLSEGHSESEHNHESKGQSESEEQHESDEQSEEGDAIQIGERAAKPGKQGLVFPDNTAAVVDSEVTLTCTGRKNSENIQWKFSPEGSHEAETIVEDCTVNDRYIDEYAVKTDKKACDLVMESVTKLLAGTYTCSDRSKPSFTASAKLIVLDSAPHCQLNIEGHKTLSAGTQVSFSCSVTYSGHAPPAMQWTDEFGDVMTSSTDSNLTSVVTTYSMNAEIPVLSPYTCKTYFNTITFTETGPKTSAANNAPTYTSSWKSKPLVVQPSTVKNFVLHKKTIQSSTYTSPDPVMAGPPELAVDGNTDGDFFHGSCTHTNADKPSWWAVDLGEERKVGRVRITNRGDAFAERLHDLVVGVTNTSPWTSPPNPNNDSICKKHADTPPAGTPFDMKCESDVKPGRYLYVLINSGHQLQLCEVEAFAE